MSTMPDFRRSEKRKTFSIVMLPVKSPAVLTDPAARTGGGVLFFRQLRVSLAEHPAITKKERDIPGHRRIVGARVR